MEGKTTTFEGQKLVCFFLLISVTLTTVVILIARVHLCLLWTNVLSNEENYESCGECINDKYCGLARIAAAEEERAAAWDDWRKVVENLVARMNPDVRPPAPSGQHVTKVFVAVDVLHLNKLNMDTGVIDLSLWIQTSWKDARMAHYQSKTTDHIVLAATKVWIPDITFLNAIGEIEPIHRPVVSYNREGKASMTQAFEVSLTCPANRTSNKQTCFVKLGSWTLDASEQELLPAEHSMTLREGWTNQQWALDNSSLDLDPFFMGFPTQKFSRLVVTLTIKPNDEDSR